MQNTMVTMGMRSKKRTDNFLGLAKRSTIVGACPRIKREVPIVCRIPCGLSHIQQSCIWAVHRTPVSIVLHML